MKLSASELIRRIDSLEMTDIVEVPAILTRDRLITSEDMNKLSPAQLAAMAAMAGGTVIYMKVRISFTCPETLLCTRKSCYRVATSGSDRCSDHPHV